MKKLILLSVFMLVLGVASQAQYSSAIGLRLGYPVSATYKKFLNDNNAFELTAGFRGYSGYSWFNVGAYYQIHKDLGSVDNLRWYYGAGANVYFWNFDNGFLNDNASNTSFGISGVLGLEYTFDDIPLAVSADWIPTFFINGYGSGFGGGYGGLAARYILGKN
jgi:hypothetical protein